MLTQFLYINALGKDITEILLQVEAVKNLMHMHIISTDGLVQDCNISIAKASDIPQS